MKKNIYLGLLTALLISIGSIAYAKTTIIPSIIVKEQYNDNIHLSSSNEEDDFITKVIPGVRFEYTPNRSMDINLDYSLRLKYYNKNTELNNTSIKDSQQLRLNAHAKPSNRVFIDVSDTYERVAIDVNRVTAIDNEITNMTDRNTFRFSYSIIVPLTPTFTSTVGYRLTNIWHRDDELVVSYRHQAFLQLRKKTSSKLNEVIEYTYTKYLPDIEGDDDDIDDYDRHQISFGFNYRVTRKFVIKGTVGETVTVTKEEWKTPLSTVTSFWDIETEYDFMNSEETSLDTTFSRTLNDSATAGAFERHNIDFRLASGKVLHLVLNPYYSIQDYSNIERKDEIAGLSVEISRPLTRKLNIEFNGEWEEQKLSLLIEDEDVTIYSLGTVFNYRLSRKIRSSIGYRYNHRDSSDESDDYKNNITWLQVRVNF